MYQLKDKDLLDHFLQTNWLLSVTPQAEEPLNMMYFQLFHAQNEHSSLF